MKKISFDGRSYRSSYLSHLVTKQLTLNKQQLIQSVSLTQSQL